MNHYVFSNVNVKGGLTVKYHDFESHISHLPALQTGLGIIIVLLIVKEVLSW